VVTINGSHFGATQQQSTVTFRGVSAEITSWSDTQIKAAVPEGATTGYALVNVPGLGSGWYWFTVLPWLKATTPPVLVPNIPITLSGQGLLPGGFETKTLLVNGTAVAADDWTDSQIIFRIPAQASGVSSISIQATFEYCSSDPWEGCYYDSTNTLTVSL